MNTTAKQTGSGYECPCGYLYNPEEGDPEAGRPPGTPFEDLPEALTCPRCERARVHFRKRPLPERPRM